MCCNINASANRICLRNFKLSGSNTSFTLLFWNIRVPLHNAKAPASYPISHDENLIIITMLRKIFLESSVRHELCQNIKSPWRYFRGNNSLLKIMDFGGSFYETLSWKCDVRCDKISRQRAVLLIVWIFKLNFNYSLPHAVRQRQRRAHCAAVY